MVNSHKPVGKSTLSSWIELEMKAARINVSKSSRIIRIVAQQLHTILETGHWAPDAIFTKFYHPFGILLIGRPSGAVHIIIVVVEYYSPFRPFIPFLFLDCFQLFIYLVAV